MAESYEYFGVAPKTVQTAETRPEFTPVVGQVTFPVIYQVGFIDVFVNGALLSYSDFTATDGVTVTLNRPSTANDVVRFSARKQIAVANTYDVPTANSNANNFFGIAAGTGDAATVTVVPSTGFSVIDGREVKVRWPAANTTTTPSISINSGAAVPVRVNGGQIVPIGSLAANQEVTLRYNGTSGFYEIVTPGVSPSIPLPKRQTVAYGPVDANGYANGVGVGTGLVPVFNGSVTPIVATFANGFGPNGSVDSVSYITSSLAFPTIPPNNTSYLFLDRNASTGVLTPGSILVAPQYGPVYNRTRQANLHFEGTAGSTSMVDDYGNTWIANGGAKLVSNQFKVGSTSLGGGGTNNATNGTTDYIRTPDITAMPTSGWTWEVWYYPTAYTTGSTGAGIFGAMSPANNTGLYVNNSGKVVVSLSSITTGNDIMNSTGTTTVPLSAWTHLAVTHDVNAGIYRVYVNGIQELSAASTLRVTPFANGFGVGQYYFGGQGFAIGYLDEFKFSPYCKYPNGTAFTPSVVPNTLEGDWFNTVSYQMMSPTAASTTAGTPPTFTAKQRLYVGEAVSGTSAVTSTVSYAYNRYYVSGWYAVAAGTQYVKAHNLGTSLYSSATDFNSVPMDSDAVVMVATTGTGGGGAAERRNRNTHIVDTSNNYVWSLSTSITGPGSATSGYYRTTIHGNW